MLTACPAPAWFCRSAPSNLLSLGSSFLLSPPRNCGCNFLPAVACVALLGSACHTHKFSCGPAPPFKHVLGQSPSKVAPKPGSMQADYCLGTEKYNTQQSDSDPSSGVETNFISDYRPHPPKKTFLGITKGKHPLSIMKIWHFIYYLKQNQACGAQFCLKKQRKNNMTSLNNREISWSLL